MGQKDNSGGNSWGIAGRLDICRAERKKVESLALHCLRVYSYVCAWEVRQGGSSHLVKRRKESAAASLGREPLQMLERKEGQLIICAQALRGHLVQPPHFTSK